MALGMEVGLGPGHTVLDMATQLAFQKGAEAPILAYFYCGHTAGCIKMPLGMEVGFSRGDFVLDGDPAPSLKRGGAPQLSAHVYCGQTAVWINMSLGTEVGLGPGEFVFGGDPAIPGKKAHPPDPICGPCLLWPNGWMDQDANWYGGKRRPRRLCVRWGRSPPLKGTQPPVFMSVVGKRLDG